MSLDPANHEENYRAMAALRATGLTLLEIGRQFGVSAQLVRRVLRKVQVERGILPITCIECRSSIDSPAVQRSDIGETVCLECLSRCPDAPFARRLRALRLAAGLTRGQLAGRAGMSESTVGQYERGQGLPGAAALHALTRVLGSDLIRGEGVSCS